MKRTFRLLLSPHHTTQEQRTFVGEQLFRLEQGSRGRAVLKESDGRIIRKETKRRKILKKKRKKSKGRESKKKTRDRTEERRTRKGIEEKEKKRQHHSRMTRMMVISLGSSWIQGRTLMTCDQSTEQFSFSHSRDSNCTFLFL